MNNYKIISLEKDQKRREALIKNLKSLNISNFEIINAVNGLDLNDNVLSNAIIELDDWWRNNKVRKNGYACTLSHIKAIKKARKDNLEYVIVLEDDCYLEKDPKTFIPDFEWDMIFIGSVFDKEIKNNISRIQKIHYTHCVMIHQKFYNKLIEYYKKYTDVIDETLNYSNIFKENNIFGINGHAYQNSKDSNILNTDNKLGIYGKETYKKQF